MLKSGNGDWSPPDVVAYKKAVFGGILSAFSGESRWEIHPEKLPPVVKEEIFLTILKILGMKVPDARDTGGRFSEETGFGKPGDAAATNGRSGIRNLWGQMEKDFEGAKPEGRVIAGSDAIQLRT